MKQYLAEIKTNCGIFTSIQTSNKFIVKMDMEQMKKELIERKIKIISAKIIPFVFVSDSPDYRFTNIH